MSSCHFIPPYLLQRVADSHDDVETARCCHSTLAMDEELRSHRQARTMRVAGPGLPVAGPRAWTVHTAQNGSSLPGKPVRSAGDPASGDTAVDEASVGVEAALGLFRDVFGRESYDGRGAPVIVTVHYGRNYDNAFWDGTQLVFGDGDGKVFERFTRPIDVLAHELAHAVTQHSAGFAYEGQSGALNESVSDVFAACVKQRVLGQTARAADWLIGEGIFTPSVNGRALRSMAEPGTAYDDPRLGKDPQVGAMDDYVRTREDNGGVHINSGIPNRAFHLVATTLGGSSWELAGQVWYSALTSGLGADTDFAAFAQATVDVASDADAVDVVDAVRSAWRAVGVVPGKSVPAPDRAAPFLERVEVRRTGGFAGVSVSGEVDLEHDARAAEVRELIGRIDFRAAATSAYPQPDRFVYAFRVQGEEVVVPEQALTPELTRLASLVLDDRR